MQFAIRPGGEDDVVFLGLMIYEAAFHPERPRPPLDEALRLPHVARWVEGWGRAGDASVIAIEDGSRPVGAAWYRLFGRYERGNEGFVDAATPVLAVATAPDRCGRGIGGALLTALMEQARTVGFAALSLSVGGTNPATRLYERQGFVKVDGRGPRVWTMRAALRGTGVG